MLRTPMHPPSASYGEPQACAVDDSPSDSLPFHLSEDIDLASLVHHGGLVEHDMSLERVEKVFRESGTEYQALVRDGRVIGVCSRRHVGILLGARFGFALHA
ncbi:MAG: hypothetical protein WC378_02950, partial [Opitutaceae bacterium]